MNVRVCMPTIGHHLDCMYVCCRLHSQTTMNPQPLLVPCRGQGVSPLDMFQLGSSIQSCICPHLLHGASAPAVFNRASQRLVSPRFFHRLLTSSLTPIPALEKALINPTNKQCRSEHRSDEGDLSFGTNCHCPGHCLNQLWSQEVLCVDMEQLS